VASAPVDSSPPAGASAVKTAANMMMVGGLVSVSKTDVTKSCLQPRTETAFATSLLLFSGRKMVHKEKPCRDVQRLLMRKHESREVG
jgi:hypothetical protein